MEKCSCTTSQGPPNQELALRGPEMHLRCPHTVTASAHKEPQVSSSKLTDLHSPQLAREPLRPIGRVLWTNGADAKDQHCKEPLINLPIKSIFKLHDKAPKNKSCHQPQKQFICGHHSQWQRYTKCILL